MIYLIKVAICDDVPEITTRVEKVLQAYQEDLFDISVFLASDKLICAIQENQFDLFILDIELPNHTGIELAETIRQVNASVPIIFLTNYSEYMEEVFRLQTFDYILKPVSEEKLFPVLKRVIRFLNVNDQPFTFTYKRVVYSLHFNDIIYFEKQKRQVVIHTIHKTYVTNMSTHTLLDKVNDSFVQVHGSFVVNVMFIKEIRPKFLSLATQSSTIEIPIGRTFSSRAREDILMKMRQRI
ncbi:LytR/AlgR family response regulator transcription factor [Pediococcus siamensis]|uniref:LytR/AlgR family response regulator transcription factor n=1 Tax=Pediococcus siamensis TaxID=381829 RepID=UPI0039A0C5F5